MKKNMYKIALLLIVVMATCFSIYYFKLQQIDSKYATKYSEVLGSYDINQVDAYLDESTRITYKGMTKKYSELRKNVITAFSQKRFSMRKDSSYGNGNDKFVNGVQVVGIQVYVEFAEKTRNNNDASVFMQLEKIGFYKFRVKALSADGEFFGYLFFGINDK